MMTNVEHEAVMETVAPPFSEEELRQLRAWGGPLPEELTHPAPDARWRLGPRSVAKVQDFLSRLRSLRADVEAKTKLLAERRQLHTEAVGQLSAATTLTDPRELIGPASLRDAAGAQIPKIERELADAKEALKECQSGLHRLVGAISLDLGGNHARDQQIAYREAESKANWAKWME